MVGLIALKDSIYKGDTMKKLLQKWLGIDSLNSNRVFKSQKQHARSKHKSKQAYSKK